MNFTRYKIFTFDQNSSKNPIPEAWCVLQIAEAFSEEAFVIEIVIFLFLCDKLIIPIYDLQEVIDMCSLVIVLRLNDDIKICRCSHLAIYRHKSKVNNLTSSFDECHHPFSPLHDETTRGVTIIHVRAK